MVMSDQGDNKLSGCSDEAGEQLLEDFRGLDDGNEAFYHDRYRRWASARAAERRKLSNTDYESVSDELLLEREAHLPHPTKPDADYNDDFRVPGDIYDGLFEYQKTCVQWLWELHCQDTGGIIGDEMGLGKTIEAIAFLAGLCYSKLVKDPILIVCPATLMKQWVNEFHKWWPPMHVSVLHSSGSGMLNISKEKKYETRLERDFGYDRIHKHSKARKAIAKLIHKQNHPGYVLITTYSGLRIHSDLLLPVRWGYCVLDEGHKIRNPDSEIALVCKQIKTTHRVIISGTPMQNNLTEVWSQFDFVYPGRLGTLPVFQTEFAVPINIGGYANATTVQVQTAYKCATMLRDLLNPYLLRRMKVDVLSSLPKKSEQVLFCKLTKPQRDAYEAFIESDEMRSIMSGKRQILYGVDVLRKICNHPDLLDREVLSTQLSYDYGSPEKSGKLVVLGELLKYWHSKGNRTLVFSQTRQMLDIIEKLLHRLSEISYCRMDGTTLIASRQVIVDEFNKNTSIGVFLLTTRVGGLGLNLTGADRVVIYDPDWNPSTDMQARERAWRLGQTREVEIYRLMSSGTIEEKIYHRQIFKQFLTNKILKDPKQRRFFKKNDLHDLFSLGSAEHEGTETGDMFAGAEISLNARNGRKRRRIEHNTKLTSLMGIVGLEDLKHDDDKTRIGKDDSDILNSLLTKCGVHSALKHDQIVENFRPETILVEREATRVAEAAAQALRISRKQVLKNEVGTPTWTGRFGGSLAGRGPSSMRSHAVLSKIRNNLEGTGNNENLPKGDDTVRLLRDIQEFMLERENKASSTELAEKFADRTTNIVLFRKLLKSIANYRTLDVSAVWELKEEYRS